MGPLQAAQHQFKSALIEISDFQTLESEVEHRIQHAKKQILHSSPPNLHMMFSEVSEQLKHHYERSPRASSFDVKRR